MANTKLLHDLGLRPWLWLGHRLLKMPYLPFVALIFSLSFLDTGLRWPWQPDADYFAVASGWPIGSSWDTSPLWIYLPSRLGLTSPGSWTILWAVVLLAIPVLLIWRTPRVLPSQTQRHFLLAILASGIPLLLLGRLGFYDLPFILGSFLVVLLPKQWWICGAVVLATSNAELGLVAALASLLVGTAFSDSNIMKRSVTVFALCVIVIITVLLLQEASEPSASRIALLSANAIQALSTNLSWLPLLIASSYLGAWIVVLLIIGSSQYAAQGALLTVGLIIVPLTFALVTLDGTRVAVAASSLAFVFALQNWFTRSSLIALFTERVDIAALTVTAMALLALLPPSIAIFIPSLTEGVFPPWQFVYLVFQQM